MGLLNSSAGYGSATKTLHWAIVVLFALQYIGAWVMLRTPDGATSLGIGQATWYNWHKSLGLLALLLAVARLVNRRLGELPPWAPTLSSLEQKLIHSVEPMLYTAMLAMPLSGFIYCMAGGYGVMLFGAWEMPNPLGTSPLLASAARAVHVVAAFALLLPLGLHLGIVLGHHLLAKDGLVRRMLPGRSR
jgi:cytochrome b561